MKLFNLLSIFICILVVQLDPIDANTEPNIPLQTGWNILGYSSPKPFLWADALVHQGAVTKTIGEAQQAGWLQSTVYYFDSFKQVSKFVPGDDDALRTNKAYWLYADAANLTLTLPGAAGSLSDNSLYFEDVNVTNGVETLSLPDAQTAGWIDITIYYYDSNGSNYMTIPGDDDYIYSWRGYWIWSNVDGLRLIIGDSSAASAMTNYNEAFANNMKMREAAAIDAHNFRANVREIQEQLIIEPVPLPGQSAPEFTLPDTKDHLVTLSEQRGKEILLVFGNTICPHCTAKIPLLNQLDGNSADSGFKVIFVAMGATPESAEKYITDRNIKFDVLIDTYGITKRKYGVRKVPEIFIIGKDGMIEYSGPQDGSAMWHLLANEPI
ncbi:MAG: TlpA family protein disulfide reductase [Planctomycetes bacterium]|nr:TlpA family protein disulfide reductase [Planctomycetota bacterium]